MIGEFNSLADNASQKEVVETGELFDGLVKSLRRDLKE